MVHIGYFIDDICLPPADLTGTCHGISFYGFTVINITPTVSSNAGALKTHILWYMESLVNLLIRDSFIISQN